MIVKTRKEISDGIPVAAYWKDTDELIGTFATVVKCMYTLVGKHNHNAYMALSGTKGDGTKRTIKSREGRRFYMKQIENPEYVYGI